MHTPSQQSTATKLSDLRWTTLRSERIGHHIIASISCLRAHRAQIPPKSVNRHAGRPLPINDSTGVRIETQPETVLTTLSQISQSSLHQVDADLIHHSFASMPEMSRPQTDDHLEISVQPIVSDHQIQPAAERVSAVKHAQRCRRLVSPPHKLLSPPLHPQHSPLMQADRCSHRPTGLWEQTEEPFLFPSQVEPEREPTAQTTESDPVA